MYAMYCLLHQDWHWKLDLFMKPDQIKSCHLIELGIVIKFDLKLQNTQDFRVEQVIESIINYESCNLQKEFIHCPNLIFLGVWSLMQVTSPLQSQAGKRYPPGRLYCTPSFQFFKAQLFYNSFSQDDFLCPNSVVSNRRETSGIQWSWKLFILLLVSFDFLKNLFKKFDLSSVSLTDCC